jgi:hypothetical protein
MRAETHSTRPLSVAKPVPAVTMSLIARGPRPPPASSARQMLTSPSIVATRPAISGGVSPAVGLAGCADNVALPPARINEVMRPIQRLIVRLLLYSRMRVMSV